MSHATDDLAAFLARHAKPYDPATDAYRRAPFAQPTKAGKNTAIYNAHSYHTKVPPLGIVPYIEHYTDPGDLVLDPFCGSGMTGVASLMAGRAAILNDLSPAAVHIARNYCTPVDVVALRREFERIRAAVAEEFAWLYGTTCDRCGGPATIQYTVWSDVFECGRCGEELALWDVAVDLAAGQVRDAFDCPHCGATWRKPQLRWLRAVPVLTNYACSSCRPSRGEHPTTAAEKARIAEIEATPIPYWYPTTPFREDDWEMWRGVHRDQGITDVSKLFTKRNLLASSRLCKEINEIREPRVRDAARFVFTSSLVLLTKLTRYNMRKRGNGPVTGTLYVASLVAENNVWNLTIGKFDDCIRTWRHGNWNTEVCALCGTATQLPNQIEGTIDYIFTDPPFGSNIFYADCNLIWEAWLDQGLTDQTHEAVVHLKHKDRNTLPDYARLMTDAFREMYRVLKPGRWASVVFHNSDDRIWQTLLEAVDAAGFELADINAFDKEQLSFKGIRGQKGLERVTNKDLVLNLHKPGPQRGAVTNGATDAVKQEQTVVAAIAAFLASNPPADDRTLQGLWNRALEHMLREGSVHLSMAQVGELLPYYFKQVDGAWYLRGEAVLGGNVFDLGRDAGALTWLMAILGNEPRTAGELIPEWQAATAQLGGADPDRLDRLLAENFWQDKRSGRWRLPTATERDQMSAQQSLADQAHLRTVRRYLDGKLTEPVNDWKRFEWARFCYAEGAFDEALALAQQIDTARLEPQQAAQLKRLIAVCRQKVEH